ncbi:MAG: hypothetical protein P4L84_18905 [Isosphaeraceae bacterium]|nr:hypothetical protein [Isosphaeraceae bacterium]
MKTTCMILSHRLSDESLDTRLGQLACQLGALFVVPTSVVALVRHPGSRIDFLFGLGLACLVGLLMVMLGILCRRGTGLQGKGSSWSRWAEFASYGACAGIFILGIRSLAGLGLTPAQVTVGLLLIAALSLAVLVCGMMTTVLQSTKGSCQCDPWA